MQVHHHGHGVGQHRAVLQRLQQVAPRVPDQVLTPNPTNQATKTASHLSAAPCGVDAECIPARSYFSKTATEETEIYIHIIYFLDDNEDFFFFCGGVRGCTWFIMWFKNKSIFSCKSLFSSFCVTRKQCKYFPRTLGWMLYFVCACLGLMKLRHFHELLIEGDLYKYVYKSISIYRSIHFHRYLPYLKTSICASLADFLLLLLHKWLSNRETACRKFNG